MVLSAFSLGYALCQLPGGVFGDRFGPRRALMLMAVAWGALNLLTGLVPGPAMASTAIIIGSLMVVRFFVGVVHAPIFPVQGQGPPHSQSGLEVPGHLSGRSTVVA